MYIPFIIYVVITIIIMYINYYFNDSVINYLYRIISVPIIFTLISNIKVNITIPKILQESSFYMYCVQDLVFRVLRTIIFKLDISNFLRYVVLFILTYVIIICSFILLKKILPRTLNILTGRRSDTCH